MQKQSVCFLDAVLTDGSVVLWVQDTALGKPREVYRITADSSQREDRLCASLSLTSATWAALSDGTGRLYLLRTGKRGDSSHMKWEVSVTAGFTALSNTVLCVFHNLDIHLDFDKILSIAVSMWSCNQCEGERAVTNPWPFIDLCWWLNGSATILIECAAFYTSLLHI